ncbi:MAG: hypothetical protein Q4E10_00325 [Porphyromonas sp.]|nr:hypothetical protein [Porphyromonas sp.]
MPSIKISKIAKDLGAGFKPIVDFLNEKDETKGYNPNSKLTADEVKSVVNRFGRELSPEQRQKLIEGYTSGAASKSEVSNNSKATQPSVTKDAGAKAQEQPQQDSEVGLKVLGKVELDAKGNVIAPAESKPEPKPEVKPEPKPEPNPKKKTQHKQELKQETTQNLRRSVNRIQSRSLNRNRSRM